MSLPNLAELLNDLPDDLAHELKLLKKLDQKTCKIMKTIDYRVNNCGYTSKERSHAMESVTKLTDKAKENQRKKMELMASITELVKSHMEQVDRLLEDIDLEERMDANQHPQEDGFDINKESVASNSTHDVNLVNPNEKETLQNSDNTLVENKSANEDTKEDKYKDRDYTRISLGQSVFSEEELVARIAAAFSQQHQNQLTRDVGQQFKRPRSYVGDDEPDSDGSKSSLRKRQKLGENCRDVVVADRNNNKNIELEQIEASDSVELRQLRELTGEEAPVAINKLSCGENQMKTVKLRGTQGDVSSASDSTKSRCNLKDNCRETGDKNKNIQVQYEVKQTKSQQASKTTSNTKLRDVAKNVPVTTKKRKNETENNMKKTKSRGTRDKPIQSGVTTTRDTWRISLSGNRGVLKKKFVLAKQEKSPPVSDNPTPVGSSEVTQLKEELFCVCNGVSSGDMIACDYPGCSMEWFHFKCVKIRVVPKGKWFCPECKQKMKQEKRSVKKKPARRK